MIILIFVWLCILFFFFFIRNDVLPSKCPFHIHPPQKRIARHLCKGLSLHSQRTVRKCWKGKAIMTKTILIALTIVRGPYRFCPVRACIFCCTIFCCPCDRLSSSGFIEHGSALDKCLEHREISRKPNRNAASTFLSRNLYRWIIVV